MVWIPKPELPYTNDFERFSNVLRLDEETGKLYWRYKMGCRCDLSKPAGTVGRNGYRVVQVFRRPYKAHRIIWLLYTGDWPKQEIDHINRVRDDNRPINLRDVSKGENILNNPHPNGVTRSGVRGVYLVGSKWQAQIQGRIIGSYPTLALAKAARERAYHAVTTSR